MDRDEMITAEDIFDEIGELYVKLGKKLGEFDRLMKGGKTKDES